MNATQFDPSFNQPHTTFSSSSQMAMLPTNPPLLSTSAWLTHLQQAHTEFVLSSTSLPHPQTSIQQPQLLHNTVFPVTHPIASALPSNYNPISQNEPLLFEEKPSPAQTFPQSTFQSFISSIPNTVNAPLQHAITTDVFPQRENLSFHGDSFILPPSLLPSSYHHDPMEYYPPLDDHPSVAPPANLAFIPPKEKSQQFHASKPNCTVKNTIRKSRNPRTKKNTRSSASVRCQFCPELFESKVNAERHRRGSHPGTPHLFQCNHCTASYESKGARTIHVNKAHPGTLSNGQIVKSRSAVRRCPKIFECLQENCDKVYSALSNLKRHFEMHHMKKRYPCSNCDYSATTRWNLKVHESRKHRDN